MKKIILPAIVLFAVFMLSSCNVDVEKEIIGKWEVKSYEVANLDERIEAKIKAGEIDESEVEKEKDMLNKSLDIYFKDVFMEFTEGKSFIVTKDEKNYEYNYVYDSQENKFTCEQKDYDETFEIFVDKLKGDDAEFTFVFSGDDGKYSVVLVRFK